MSLSYEQFGHSLRISKRTVEQYIKRAEKAQVGWPLCQELDDEQLELLLFPAKAPEEADLLRQMDYEWIEEELKNKK